MNILKTSFRGPRRLFTSLSFTSLLSVVVLLAGVLPTPLEAQGRRDFGHGGGPRFGVGFGWGIGLGLLGGLAVSNVYGGNQYVYAAPPPVYYYPQVAPQYVVVNPAPTVVYSTPAPSSPAPAPTLAAALAPVAPTTVVAGKSGRVVYDSNAKPVGVIIVNADGSQEFVPLTQ